MAKQPTVDRVVCPLFADVEPPVYADEVGEIRVYKVLGSKDRGTPVVFSKRKYVLANNGEEFVIDPGSTKEDELITVLEADPPGTQFFISAYDNRTGHKIVRAQKLLRTDGEPEDEEVVDDEPAPSSGDRMVDVLTTVLLKQQQPKEDSVSLAIQMADAMTRKESPSAIVEELRAEIKDIRRKADAEVDEARAKYKRESEVLYDQLRSERTRAERREDEHRAELRDLRQQTQNQIYTLQQQNLDLQQRAGQDLLSTRGTLMQAELDKKMAERDAHDAQSALEAVNESRQTSAAEEAAAQAIPGWMKPLVPFIPLAVQALKAQGVKVPKELEQMSQPQQAAEAPTPAPAPAAAAARPAPQRATPVQPAPAAPVMPVAIPRAEVTPEEEEDEEGDEFAEDGEDDGVDEAS